jgi:hypothetical protein
MGGKNPIEASPLGNPFKLANKSPEEIARCLDEYRSWLTERIRTNDAQIMALLREITAETTLACYCVSLSGEAIFDEPERCHAQIIWKSWMRLKATGVI